MITRLALLAALLLAPLAASVQAPPLPMRIIVVTAFEIGAETGDKRGEFQAWATSYPSAMRSPAILFGDEVTGQTFWYGALFNGFAERWTRHRTKGTGSFVMTRMEDSGVARPRNVLGQLGKADPRRLMALRTAANYTVQPPDVTAADSLEQENGGLSALQTSLVAHLVGRKLVDGISGHWPLHADMLPGSPGAVAR